MARLTVQLDEETIAALRELAGGERKVHVYLTQLVRDLQAGRLLRQDEVEEVSQRLSQIEADMSSRVERLETTLREVEDLVARVAAKEKQE